MNELTTTHLLREHREVEKVAAILSKLLDAQNGVWNAERAADYQRVCAFFERDVLCHLRKEDELLFHMLEEFLPRDTGPLAVLRTEHAEISSLYACLRHAGEALCRGAQNPQAGQDFLRYGRRLLQVIADHIYKEDRVLFPMVARFLNPEQDHHLLMQMEALTPLPVSTTAFAG